MSTRLRKSRVSFSPEADVKPASKRSKKDTATPSTSKQDSADDNFTLETEYFTSLANEALETINGQSHEFADGDEQNHEKEVPDVPSPRKSSRQRRQRAMDSPEQEPEPQSTAPEQHQEGYDQDYEEGGEQTETKPIARFREHNCNFHFYVPREEFDSYYDPYTRDVLINKAGGTKQVATYKCLRKGWVNSMIKHMAGPSPFDCVLLAKGYRGPSTKCQQKTRQNLKRFISMRFSCQYSSCTCTYKLTIQEVPQNRVEPVMVFVEVIGKYDHYSKELGEIRERPLFGNRAVSKIKNYERGVAVRNVERERKKLEFEKKRLEKIRELEEKRKARIRYLEETYEERMMSQKQIRKEAASQVQVSASPADGTVTVVNPLRKETPKPRKKITPRTDLGTPADEYGVQDDTGDYSAYQDQSSAGTSSILDYTQTSGTGVTFQASPYSTVRHVRPYDGRPDRNDPLYKAELAVARAKTRYYTAGHELQDLQKQYYQVKMYKMQLEIRQADPHFSLDQMSGELQPVEEHDASAYLNYN